MRMFLRPATQDQQVWEEVFHHNIYNLPDQFPPNTVVLDVGAHVGCFTAACLARNVKHVVAIEPDPDNAEMYRRNLQDYIDSKHVTFLHGGIAASSDYGGPTRIPYIQADCGNTACGVACDMDIDGDKQFVTAYGIDQLMDIAINKEAEVILLKIDAEGGEYHAIYQMDPEDLKLLDAIIGETHQPTRELTCKDIDGRPWPMNHAGIVAYLGNLGFQFSLRQASPNKPHTNMEFWAENSAFDRQMFPSQAGRRPVIFQTND